MRRVAIVVAVLVLVADLAVAAEWGLIRPAVSTMESVRARYGAPSRVVREKVEGYETEGWIYEEGRAPTGLIRLTVEFGLVQSDKYRRDVVRAFRLEPKAGTFNRGVITNGWGLPDRMSRAGDEDMFLYKDGLMVFFEKGGWNARLMVFTLPQPRDPTEERR